MKKYLFIGAIMMLSFVLVSCGNTSDNSKASATASSKSSSGGSTIYFMTSSEDENEVKANWVAGVSNENALQVEENKPVPKKTTNTKSNTNTNASSQTTNTITNSTTTANTSTSTNRTNNTTNVQNNTTSTNPTANYPRDSTADANTIIEDPYSEASNTEVVDDKQVSTDTSNNN